jgi:hypothetical protein
MVQLLLSTSLSVRSDCAIATARGHWTLGLPEMASRAHLTVNVQVLVKRVRFHDACQPN